MSEAFSTSPGFADPIPVRRTRWLGRHREHASSVRMRSGVVIALPLLFWEARALVLNGVADADAVDGLPGFRESGLRAEHVDPRTLKKQGGTGKAVVAIWAPDYGGTTVGPIKAVFAAVRVERRPDCQHVTPPAQGGDPDHLWWWWYYSNSVVNQEFKRDVWGIPNELGLIETTYDSPTKGVRLLENGRIALRLRLELTTDRVASWWIVKMPFEEPVAEAQILSELQRAGESLKSPAETVKAPHERGPLVFVTVARRTHDDGENEVELLGAKTWAVSDRIDGGKIPFDADRDVFHVGADTAVKKHLERVDFEPVAWDFFTGYNGVVRLYDDKGRAKPRVRPDEKLVEAIEKGLTSYEEAVRRRSQAR